MSSSLSVSGVFSGLSEDLFRGLAIHKLVLYASRFPSIFFFATEGVQELQGGLPSGRSPGLQKSFHLRQLRFRMIHCFKYLFEDLLGMIRAIGRRSSLLPPDFAHPIPLSGRPGRSFSLMSR